MSATNQTAQAPAQPNYSAANFSLNSASDPWLQWRQQMPIAQKWAYLDHAAVGPLPSVAAAAIHEFADQASQQGDTVWPQWAAKIEKLRKNAAILVGADADEICMVPNTSTGINLVAEGFPWQEGDNVVVPEGEFPSNLFPWMNQQTRGVQLRTVPRRGEQVCIDDVISHVDQSTRMIAVSWVGYASGYRIDVDELVQRAHEKNVLVFLDAIQGLGIYPLDLAQTPVDFLAADGHKWLLGPEGAGIAMIRRQHLNQLRCGNVGWGSVKNSFNYNSPEFNLRDTAARFEPGSANMVGIAALSANLELFLTVRDQLGASAIGDRIIDLANYLHERLLTIGITSRLPEKRQHQSGIVTFDVDGVDPAEVRQRGLDQQIVVSCRGGGIRASIHAYNNHSDLDRLVDVVAQATR
ncbi:aminotransferase class V-fold PLP-dependent enzyme [Stieleria marina]|uniref:Cysteine desulfurase n=1 Tax=Stieleria marina TaxID=1930275 RepID=A0A517NSQ2_9BACT|nr:Cysteine desulfurase [Planctomycetes bacterium K23_9]